jgi:hypothetical protein
LDRQHREAHIDAPQIILLGIQIRSGCSCLLGHFGSYLSGEGKASAFGILLRSGFGGFIVDADIYAAVACAYDFGGGIVPKKLLQ